MPDARIKPYPKPSSLELLDDTLWALRCNQNMDVLVKIGRHLMQEVIEQNPSSISFADGRSIMAACAQSHPPLCLTWWELRGREAWMPTPANSLPLMNFIAPTGPLRGMEDAMDMTSWDFGAPAEAFWNDAVRSCLPLTRTQGDAWKVGEALNDEQRDLLETQRQLILYCLSDHDGMAHMKTKALIDHDALLTSHIFKDVKVEQFINNTHLSPTLMLLDEAALQQANSEKWITWANSWTQWKQYSKSDEVLIYLDKHQCLTETLKDYFFADGLQQMIMDSTFSNHPLSAMGAWKKVREAMDQTNRWQQIDQQGYVLWQTLIKMRPSLLPAVLKAPPPDGLQTISPTKGGLWDCVLDGLCVRAGASISALNGLARKLPVCRISTAPLLWRWWTIKDSPHDAFLDATGQNHPDIWLGSKKEQRKGGITLLASLCNSNVHSQSMRKVKALLNPILNLEDADDELRLVARIIQEVVSAVPELRRQFENVEEKVLTGSTQAKNSFLTRLERAIANEEGGCGDYEPHIALQIRAATQRYVLSLNTAHSPSQNSPGRRRI